LKNQKSSKTTLQLNKREYSGKATLVDKNTIDVNGEKITAKNILLATGGTPIVPNFKGAELCCTSDQFFEIPKQPKKVIVIGAGYIAVEFGKLFFFKEIAGIFNALGTEVDLLIRHKKFLRTFDSSVADILMEEMKRSGINIHSETEAQQVEKTENGLVLTTKDGKKLVADCVVLAIGRSNLIFDLNLEKVGVKIEKGKKHFLNVQKVSL
jgi:glutathione reductase (NADPH)